MHVVRNHTIENRVVYLDDHKFIRCRLIECEVRYSGGIYSLDETTVENCTFVLNGAAQRTANLVSEFDLTPRNVEV